MPTPLPTPLTAALPAAPDLFAPDGMEVRLLLARAGGSMAHFALPGGQASRAMRHRSVEELWFILSGHGEIWRADSDDAGDDGGDGGGEVTPLAAGVCVAIPLGTRFQLRATGAEPLAAVAITMPPWPGADEAVAVEGRWPATV